jgi:hypothetical protein
MAKIRAKWLRTAWESPIVAMRPVPSWSGLGIRLGWTNEVDRPKGASWSLAPFEYSVVLINSDFAGQDRSPTYILPGKSALHPSSLRIRFAA